MEVVKVEKILNLNDVEELNKFLPDVIEIKSLKGQKYSVLSKIDSKIKVRILEEELEVDKELKKDEKETYISKTLKDNSEINFSSEEISAILKEYEKIEEDISVNYSDLESALHVYLE